MKIISKVSGCAIFFIFFLNSFAFPEEQITITTYYPSPLGSYNELRAKKMGIGANYYLPGTVIDDAQDVDLLVEGSVGIGTATPSGNTRKLSVISLDNKNAIYAQSSSSYGLYGESSSNYGVYGKSASSDGLYGESSTKYGVHGKTAGSYGIVGEGGSVGVAGWGIVSGGTFGCVGHVGNIGVSGYGNDFGVQGTAASTLPESLGAYFEGSKGVYGRGRVSYGVQGEGTTVGVYGTGQSFGVAGTGSAAGVFGDSTSASGRGIYGNAYIGVYGEGTNTGVHGKGPTAGYFDGNVKVTQTLYCDTVVGADIAENYIVGDDALSGDIVVIDPEHPDTLTKSKSAYSSLVAGIISSSPALVIGGKKDEKANYQPVALKGRVKCKVTNEGGTIKRGDILVSSSTAGHAMKADLQKIILPTMVVGIAMQDVAAERGEIEVFVK